MNATNITIENTNETPWVESGAMVYVAITVATMSAVIMCCTWFVTHNKPMQRWWNGSVQYNGIGDDEEEIQLTPVEEEERESGQKFYTDEPSSKEAFTLDDLSDSSSETEGNDEAEVTAV